MAESLLLALPVSLVVLFILLLSRDLLSNRAAPFPVSHGKVGAKSPRQPCLFYHMFGE